MPEAGEGEGSQGSMGTEFLVCKMKRVLRWMVVMVA